MGTNYYLISGVKRKRRLHVGKSSCGWRFLFHKTNAIYDINSLYKKLNSETSILIDEYDRVIDKEWFIQLVLDKQKENRNSDVENIDGFDFLQCDFC